MIEHEQLRVIDAHHHLWDLSRPGYAWLQGEPQDASDPSTLGAVQRDYLIHDYTNDAASVVLEGSVHVEANYGANPVDETKWLGETALHSGLPSVIVAGARLQADDLEAVLSAHMQEPRVRGIRQMLNWSAEEQVAELPDLMSNSRWRAGLAGLARHGLSFDLQVFPSQLAEAARLAADFPEVSFVLNHGGFLQRGDEIHWRDWESGIRLMAVQPNVAVKASSYVTVDPSFAGDGFKRFLSELLDVFGVDRVMFGSNFPLDRRSVSFESLIERHLRALRGITSAERDAFFAGTARRVYRMDESSIAGSSPNRTTRRNAERKME